MANHTNANPENLADLLDNMPVDGPTGGPITDGAGRPDDPHAYEVLEFQRTNDGFRAQVRGPSGTIDLVVSDMTGARIYRDRDYTTLFEAGEGDGYWTLEEAPDGLLCITTNAETRRVIEPDQHWGRDADALCHGLATAGMPEDLILRYLEQADLL